MHSEKSLNSSHTANRLCSLRAFIEKYYVPLHEQKIDNIDESKCQVLGNIT